MPGDDEARTVVTARDSDTHSSGTAGLECEESALTGESVPAEKHPEPFRLARRWLS